MLLACKCRGLDYSPRLAEEGDGRIRLECDRGLSGESASQRISERHSVKKGMHKVFSQEQSAKG